MVAYYLPYNSFESLGKKLFKLYAMLIFYSLLSDNDECADGSADCKVFCINTVGSYKCGCNEGHELSTDGTTCKGELCLYVSFNVKYVFICLKNKILFQF